MHINKYKDIIEPYVDLINSVIIRYNIPYWDHQTYILFNLEPWYFSTHAMHAVMTAAYYLCTKMLKDYFRVLRVWWKTDQPWASCQIREIAGTHAPGILGMFSPPPRVSDPDMHHGTCVTHVPWCMPGSLVSGFLWGRPRGKTFPAFPAHAQPTILRIW